MKAQTHMIMHWVRWLAAGLMTVASFSLQAGVAGSRHDLSAAVGSTSNEVCVFCHTPHGSDTSAAVPLWNKILPTSGYTKYSTLNTSSMDAAELAVGSVSLACLSCHDGGQAMDVVINAPGSTATDTLLYNKTTGVVMGGTGAMTNTAGDFVPMLGTDLTDDHPIGIQYAAGGCISTDANGLCAGTLGDADFNFPYKDTINTNPIWWVDNGTVGTRTKADMHLYTRTFSGVVQPSVECGSCHDPHNDTTFNNTGNNKSVAFLRVANASSIICTTCHIK